MDVTTNADRPLWQRRWFQILVAVLVGLLVLSFVVPPIFAVIYALRSVLAPVLIGFGLAYVVHPVITHVHLRYGVPRWLSTAAIMLVGVLTVITFLLLVVPPLVVQGTELIVKLKDVYPRALVEVLGEPPVETPQQPSPDADPQALPQDASPADVPAANNIDAAIEVPADGLSTDDPSAVTPDTTDDADDLSWRQRLSDPEQRQILFQSLADWFRSLDWATVSTAAARSLDIGVGVVGSAISFTTYLLLAVVVIAFCFFYFAWKFSDITRWFTSFIPASQRVLALDLIHKMDRSVNAFIRGRLVQAAVMMFVLSVGWWIFGVPYWLLLGVASGILNLVPFLVVIGWIVALMLTVVDHTTGSHGFTIWTLLGPTLVYVFAQSFDGWIVEPLVQGRATNLDPLTVLLVVLIGGSLAGLLGMLIAIPTAACIKILAREFLLPRLRELAAAN